MKNKEKIKMAPAVVLLSGGLDSAVTLYFALKQGHDCSCLIFDYGQRHRRELMSARSIAKAAGCPSHLIKIDLPWKGSSLIDKKMHLPVDLQTNAPKKARVIPSTYVPGRNIIFLSYALSYAEASGAKKIFIGAHAQDYSGYPDCRPEFYRAFDAVSATGTKAGVEKKRIAVETPLIDKKKSDIISMGQTLGVPFELTWSCYKGGAAPCGKCDSCFFRAKGFEEARIKDPA